MGGVDPTRPPHFTRVILLVLEHLLRTTGTSSHACEAHEEGDFRRGSAVRMRHAEEAHARLDGQGPWHEAKLAVSFLDVPKEFSGRIFRMVHMRARERACM